MSIIHVNQIKNHVSRLFDGKIDMLDAGKPGPDYDNPLSWTGRKLMKNPATRDRAETASSKAVSVAID